VKLKGGFAMTGCEGISIVGNGSVAISQSGIVKVGRDSIGIVLKLYYTLYSKPYFYGGMGSLFIYAPKLEEGAVNTPFVFAAKVDGINILANTWYTVENGEFVETKESFLDDIY
jgi:hypothetical protein